MRFEPLQKVARRKIRLKNANTCHFERSDQAACKAQAAAKKSTEFKTRLKFVDTSPKAQYDKSYKYDKNFVICQSEYDENLSV